MDEVRRYQILNPGIYHNIARADLEHVDAVLASDYDALYAEWKMKNEACNKAYAIEIPALKAERDALAATVARVEHLRNEWADTEVAWQVWQAARPAVDCGTATPPPVERSGEDRHPLDGAAKRALGIMAEAQGDQFKRRVYYQNIVYEVCNLLDRLGGMKTIAGTANAPSRDVQERVEGLVLAAKPAHGRDRRRKP